MSLFNTGTVLNQVDAKSPCQLSMNLIDEQKANFHNFLTLIEFIKAVSSSVIWTTDIGAEFGDVRPLGEVGIRTLIVNGGHVSDSLVTDVAFVTELASAGCITWSQREHLNNMLQPRDRNVKLIEFLTRRSVAHFQKFINVLAKEQAHLVSQFLSGGGKTCSVRIILLSFCVWEVQKVSCRIS